MDPLQDQGPVDCRSGVGAGDGCDQPRGYRGRDAEQLQWAQDRTFRPENNYHSVPNHRHVYYLGIINEVLLDGMKKLIEALEPKTTST